MQEKELLELIKQEMPKLAAEYDRHARLHAKYANISLVFIGLQYLIILIILFI